MVSGAVRVNDPAEIPPVIISICGCISVSVGMADPLVLIVISEGFFSVFCGDPDAAHPVIAFEGDQTPVLFPHIGQLFFIVVAQLHDTAVRKGLLQHPVHSVVGIFYACDASGRQDALQPSVEIIFISVGVPAGIDEPAQFSILIPEADLPSGVVFCFDQIFFFIVGIVKKTAQTVLCIFQQPFFVISEGPYASCFFLTYQFSVPVKDAGSLFLLIDVSVPGASEFFRISHLRQPGAARGSAVRDHASVFQNDFDLLFSFRLFQTDPVIMAPALAEISLFAALHGVIQKSKGERHFSACNQILPLINVIAGIHVDGIFS